jgi:wobble nucleotide-excising tRNase
MIDCLRLLRNVGQFDSVAAGADLPLARFSVIYAENGRGKTTIAAILRSLANGDGLPVAERHRLAAQHPPHVVIDCSDGTPAVFEDGQWSRTLPEVTIFDDVFVDENIYSGLVVGAGHRQNLHELILGAQGVALTRQLDTLRRRIEAHNAALRTKAAVIPDAIRGGLTVDQFCALPPRSDIEDAIVQARRALAAGREQDQVRATHAFDSLSLPEIDETALDELLARDLPSLDTAAAARVEEHLSTLGGQSEGWVAHGMALLEATERDHDLDACPFCLQGIGASPIIDAYRAYFSSAYATHVQEIAGASTAFRRNHGGEVFAAFERGVRVASERRQFWSAYCDVPDLELDTAAIIRSWRDAADAVGSALAGKEAAPLQQIALPAAAKQAIADYEMQRELVARRSGELQEANGAVQLVKEQAASANPQALEADLSRLLAVEARHTTPIDAHCTEYLDEKAGKAITEAARTQARTDLDAYRANAFPGYETTINLYLSRFNAGFRLDRFTPADTRGGPSCTYNVIINNTAVPVSGHVPSAGEPSFRNTLSAGDRNTLALAFFFASLDLDPDRSGKIVVIDDPISSLDEHRSLTTVQEVRRLGDQSQQLIVLSHTKAFLCRLWESSDRSARAALQVTRQGDGSTFEAWDVDADSETEHDRRHALLSNYLVTPSGDPRAVARAIRPHVESFLRVAFPEEFPASTLLGTFRNVCEQRVGAAREVLTRQDTDELSNLVEYANRFHHDTNPAWETEAINDSELHGFVARTLSFVKR